MGCCTIHESFKKASKFFKIYSVEFCSVTPSVQFSSVQLLSCVRLFATHKLQHARPPCPSPTPRVYANSCPSSRWYHPAISSSVILFSFCPQSLPASRSFPMSQPFVSKYWIFSFSISPSNEYPGLISPTVFNLSLNLAIRSSWSEPQSSPGLVFADRIELLHLWLQRL